ncbi:uncharacterized protein K02A2.6-like [Ornithodoros turicata]|uniref:uncharacterized protein K02A2.6-like n=1 Tax=Ornithodoros turicata TaxID=34597 RepID=UPI003139922C
MNHARLGEFTAGSDWTSWRERLEFLFEANDVRDAAKKRALLFTCIGEETYNKVRDLLHPLSPSQVPYHEIMDKLNLHFETGPSELLGRWRYHKRDQRPQESISEYVDALRALAKDCNFGTLYAGTSQTVGTSPAATPSTSRATEPEASTTTTPSTVGTPATTTLPLEIMLRDRFICGLRDVHVQQRLLSERSITFQKAFDIAKAMESTVQQQSSMRSTEGNKILNTTTKQRNSKTGTKQTCRCYRCNGDHNAQNCRFRKSVCNFCKKIGHIEKACISKKRQQSGKTTDHDNTRQSQQHRQTNCIEATETEAWADLFSLHTSRQATNRYTIEVTLDNRPCVFEVDSGASFSIISEETFHHLWNNDRPTLHSATFDLKTWTGTPLQVRGKARVHVKLQHTEAELDLYVVAGCGVSLLGRDWFEPLGISVTGINTVAATECQALLDEFKEVFQGNMTGHEGNPIHIDVQRNTAPKFLKSRTVPLALRHDVDKELSKLQHQGIIEPVSSSLWATPLVTVRKQDGTLRLCGDYRSTVNVAVAKAAYPLPTVDDMLSIVQGGKIFSKLDLQQAYQQLRVDKPTSELLTLNTPKGLFRVTRLPFGVSVAPIIFQRYMDTLLSGLVGVGAYLDDILITGSTQEEHNERLRAVLQRLRKAGLKARFDKCLFAVPELEYLGYHIQSTGITPTRRKVQAIIDAPAPRSRKELQSFLGLLSFYNRFLKDRATVAEPLYRLLDKQTSWKWGHQEQSTFEELKQLLVKAPVLAHFDESRPIILSCDASPYGVGAVLSQQTVDGDELPIMFASRTLGTHERNYAHLDKEGLSIVFGMKHFHHFIAGRHITVFTDHKPLLGILSPNKQIPQMLSPRMIRWCLLLSAYDYTLVYRPGNRHQNADALSRLPLPISVDGQASLGDVLMLEALHCDPLNANQVAQLTQRDVILSRVLEGVQRGDFSDWNTEDLLPYRRRRSELAVCKGCLTWGSRVIIPQKAQPLALRMLHANHPGVAAMKSTARSHFWWPGLDHDIQLTFDRCHTCQTWARASPCFVDEDFKRPDAPWHTLHIDFAGPMDGWSYLIIVDAFSKWLEVRRLRTTTSGNIIHELRNVFATFGIPRVLFSDNAPNFVSGEMSEFCKRNGIKQRTSAPFHPATNGQAERMVAETKKALRKLTENNTQCRLARFLFRQHTTVSKTTGKTPGELLFGRPLTTAWNLLHPQEHSDNMPKESSQTTEKYKVGQPVYIRMFHSGPRWLPATILKQTGRSSFAVTSTDGRLHRRHVEILAPNP